MSHHFSVTIKLYSLFLMTLLSLDVYSACKDWPDVEKEDCVQAKKSTIGDKYGWEIPKKHLFKTGTGNGDLKFIEYDNLARDKHLESSDGFPGFKTGYDFKNRCNVAVNSKGIFYKEFDNYRTKASQRTKKNIRSIWKTFVTLDEGDERGDSFGVRGDKNRRLYSGQR